MNRPVAWQGASIVLHMLLVVWFVRSGWGAAGTAIPSGRTITDASSRTGSPRTVGNHERKAVAGQPSGVHHQRRFSAV